VSHLHIFARLANGELTGNGRRLTSVEAQVFLAQHGYRDSPELNSVVKGKFDRGYHVNNGGVSWVAVSRCDGGTDRECAAASVSVVTGADIRALSSFGK
jgi:hypothetical protein